MVRFSDSDTQKYDTQSWWRYLKGVSLKNRDKRTSQLSAQILSTSYKRFVFFISKQVSLKTINYNDGKLLMNVKSKAWINNGYIY